jgi:hypothetical protein
MTRLEQDLRYKLSIWSMRKALKKAMRKLG